MRFSSASLLALLCATDLPSAMAVPLAEHEVTVVRRGPLSPKKPAARQQQQQQQQQYTKRSTDSDSTSDSTNDADEHERRQLTDTLRNFATSVGDTATGAFESVQGLPAAAANTVEQASKLKPDLDVAQVAKDKYNYKIGETCQPVKCGLLLAPVFLVCIISAVAEVIDPLAIALCFGTVAAFGVNDPASCQGCPRKVKEAVTSRDEKHGTAGRRTVGQERRELASGAEVLY